jgi:hypothetical protein
MWRIASVAIPFIWFGLLLGISFIEAPLKFYAPGITLGLGLGIGRLVFGVMNKVEIVLGIVLLISILRTKPSGHFVKIAVAIILSLLLLETVWLLPLLDVRAQAVIDGTGAPYSNMHIVYIAFDVVKLLLLFATGIILTRQMSHALK